MQLFYHPTALENDQNFYFDKEESKHIVKVLRKNEGDILHVTNGLGTLFTTEIVHASPSKCEVNVISKITEQARAFGLHLAVAPTKLMDRYEWFLEKAVEIGVQTITPLICDHSERTVIKLERIEKIVLGAMKQSNQLFLPTINEVQHFKTFIKNQPATQKLIAHCEETKKFSLKESLQPKQSTLILIGPEGDFSSKEIELALQNNYKPVSLSETRLRTETAAIVACHSFVFVNESLK
jgi:16S rRNA (uracil1498-N3)-methyltransferase